MDFVEADKTECPRYENCRTGKVITPKPCTRFKCNTYYQIDTLEICRRINAYLANRPSNSNGNSCMSDMNGHRVEADIARIVEEAVQEDLRKLGQHLKIPEF